MQPPRNGPQIAREDLHGLASGSSLRFELRQRRLELRPTAEGIVAVFMEGNNAITSREVDLDSSPDALLDEWVGQIA